MRTESNEMQSTPELKGSLKKDAQDMSDSKRKGKAKAVAAAVSDDGEDEEAQEGNGKEGKASTADFIRRLWTMVSIRSVRNFSQDGLSFLAFTNRCKRSRRMANSEKAASFSTGVQPGTVLSSRTSTISRRISWFSIFDIVISPRLCGN